MASNNNSTATTAPKVCLVFAKVQLIDSKGVISEEHGYVMANGKFEAMNKILARYSTLDLKVTAIPEVEEARDVNFIIN